MSNPTDGWHCWKCDYHFEGRSAAAACSECGAPAWPGKGPPSLAHVEEVERGMLVMEPQYRMLCRVAMAGGVLALLVGLGVAVVSLFGLVPAALDSMRSTVLVTLLVLLQTAITLAMITGRNLGQIALIKERRAALAMDDDAAASPDTA